MKKISITLILTFISLIAFSQNSKFAIGIEIGPTIAKLIGKPVNKQDPRVAIEFAVNTELTLNDHFAIMPAFGFERKGSSAITVMYDRIGEETGNETVKINYDYLIFPLLLKYYPSEKKKFYWSAGPYFGYLLSCKEKIGSQTIDIKNQVQNFDFGVAAGFGFIYPLTDNLHLDCGTRFNIGLLNTQKLDIYGDGEAIRTFSFGFLSCLKYKF